MSLATGAPASLVAVGAAPAVPPAAAPPRRAAGHLVVLLEQAHDQVAQGLGRCPSGEAPVWGAGVSRARLLRDADGVGTIERPPAGAIT